MEFYVIQVDFDYIQMLINCNFNFIINILIADHCGNITYDYIAVS